jgi:hypothetical protein
LVVHDTDCREVHVDSQKNGHAIPDVLFRGVRVRTKSFMAVCLKESLVRLTSIHCRKCVWPASAS